MKCLWLVLLFLSVTIISFAQADLNRGLIGCYPFSGNANDLSPSANHGSVQGARLTADRFGTPNSAYDFDGIDDFIEVGAGILELNEFSYSLWVYPRNLPAYQQALFIISVGSALGDQYLLIGNQYPDVLHGFANGSYMAVGYDVRCMTNELPDLNKWYHLVLTKDVNQYSFYVDGSLICHNPTLGGSAFYGVGTVKATIGARNNYGQATNAIIDDVHLYNRALTSEEVTDLYRANFGEESVPVVLVSDSTSYCTGEKVNVVAEITDFPDINIEWSVNNQIISTGTSRSFSYQIPSGSNIPDVKISVKVTAQNTCFPASPGTAELKLLIGNCETPNRSRQILVPSIFTPNEDGDNDDWRISNAEIFENLEILVYNRWGTVVFHSTDYSTPWTGLSKGTKAPIGVYVYKIFSEKKLIKEGSVMIVY